MYVKCVQYQLWFYKTGVDHKVGVQFTIHFYCILIPLISVFFFFLRNRFFIIIGKQEKNSCFLKQAFLLSKAA